MDFSICRSRAAYYVEQARSASPERAAFLFSMAAQRLQKAFGKLSNKSYPHGGVAELVRETASLRQTASQNYQNVGEVWKAGLELSRGARCLESFAQYLIENKPSAPLVSKEHLIQLLNEALRYRSSAADFFRSVRGTDLNLAFELSYRSRTMSFLVRHCPEHNTPETLGQIAQDLSESALIFENHREYNEAYFGYWHLTMSLMNRARTDPSYYLPAVFSIHRAIEMIEKGRLPSVRIAKLYRIAAEAYCRLAEACNDSYVTFYLEQAREMALKAAEAGGTPDGKTTRP